MKRNVEILRKIDFKLIRGKTTCLKACKEEGFTLFVREHVNFPFEPPLSEIVKYRMVGFRVICGLILSLICPGLIESVNWVDSITQRVIEDWDIQYVLIIEQFMRNESALNPQVHNLRRRLIQKVPTITCKIGYLVETRDSSIDHALNEVAAYDTSTTFYVIVSDFSKYSPLKSTIEALAALSQWKSNKILLLLISQKPRKKLKGLLKFAWSKKILDFTIIELIEPQVTQAGSLHSFPLPIIHGYNPFKRQYTRSNWTLGESFFPQKALNMWGYPLKIGILHEPPMSFVKFNESDQTPISLKGANINMAKLMAERLNFTIIWIPFRPLLEDMKDPTPSGLYEIMNSDKIDLLASMSPHHSKSKEYRIQRTAYVIVDSMCPVVPITKSIETLSIADVCRLYLVILIILIGLWIPAYLLKFDRRNWKPINIFQLFMGSGWRTVPKKNVERIVFACILFLSVIYFSTIFLSSTKTRLVYDKTASIKSFEELDESGLTPVVSSYLYNKTFANSEGFLPNLRKKSIPVNDIHDCPFYAAKYKNVTCIMGEQDMLLTMQANKNYGHRLKIVRPCFWSDTHGFLLGKSSPYRHYLNKVISYAHTSGLISKWYTKLDDFSAEDWPPNLGEEDTPQIDEKNNNPALVRQLMTIITLGIVASSFIFIGEIIVYSFV